MLTVGTAGHIDHGKSSLVKALTTIDPDRLPEEKARGMTIDLGFAWFALPSGENVGIVDVPGHKQFVHNVIPGLFGIDAFLLVVAADDGWMPQTEEHVQILDLLGIHTGFVVLNKVDLAEPDWLELVEKDIAAHLANTGLAGTPILRVSARTGAGIPELKQAIGRLAGQIAPRHDIGKPRLAIDRDFTIKGSGVVVTGTLAQGVFHTGDDVVLAPCGQPAHIRSVESYKEMRGEALPGSRVALNLAGLKREDVQRGNIVLSAKYPVPVSRTLDVEMKLLPGLPQPLRHMAEVLVYLETRELLGRVVLPGEKVMAPGTTAMPQIRFIEDVTAFTGERFIIRQQSPARTIGGGIVLDPQAERFKLADLPARQAFLEKRRSLSLEALVLSEVSRRHYTQSSGLLLASLFSQAEVAKEVKRLVGSKQLVEAPPYLVEAAFWQGAAKQILDYLTREHEADKLKQGTPQAVLQGALQLPKDIFDALVASLVSTGKLARQEDILALPQYRPSLSGAQEQAMAAIMKLFAQNPGAPPGLRELTAQMPASMPVVRYLIQQGKLVELPEGILMEAGQFKSVQDFVTQSLKDKGQITIQELAARFGFSRKFTIPLLTRFDQLGLTRREGDMRVPGKRFGLPI